MANKLYEEASVQDIANALREKNGTTNTYKIAEMGAAVRQISADVTNRVEAANDATWEGSY